MRRALLVCLVALIATVAPAQQGETLADIRQDIVVLQRELQRLGQELNTTGLREPALAGSPLDRITAIERELQRVTAKTEELEFRIGQVVRDGTNRLDDLLFRVCELDPGCDIGRLGETPALGGDALVPRQAAPVAPVPRDLVPSGVELTILEARDFEDAQAALEAGEFDKAVQLFSNIRERFPLGPLEAPSLVGEGLALEGLGNMREAARRYLTAFTGSPDAEIAPEALWRLGTSLAEIGALDEACLMLLEVGNRFPDSPFANQAQSSRAALTCS